jgi:polysaccharide export outer membrane protein
MLRSISGAAGRMFLVAAWGAGLALCAGQAPTTDPSQPAPPAPVPAAQAAIPDQQPLDALPLGAGDVLQISVWKEPDASVPSVVVRPDGMITVPLLKDIQVVGRTPREVEKIISDGLSKGNYIRNPNVTVVVAASNSKKVYVIGAVAKEGPLPYTYRMTVLQALSEAGGLTDYAKRKKIYIIRTESGRDYRLDFNYDEAIKGERMDRNILLQPGDTLVIPH